MAIVEGRAIGRRGVGPRGCFAGRCGPSPGFVLILVSLLFAQDIFATHFTPWPSIRGTAIWGRDFANVYTSGTLALEGRLDLLYDLKGYAAWQDTLFQGALRDHNYSYPPPTLLYTWAFALLPYPVALLSWLLLTGAAFAAAARPYLRDAGLPAGCADRSGIFVNAGPAFGSDGALWLRLNPRPAARSWRVAEGDAGQAPLAIRGP